MEVRVPYSFTTAKNTLLRYLYVILLSLFFGLSIKFDLFNYS
jgi:hypothetical protein